MYITDLYLNNSSARSVVQFLYGEDGLDRVHEAAHAAPGTKVQLVVRGKPLPATVTAMPFVPHRYFRKP